MAHEVVVVGGGVVGLSIAYELGKKGRRVAVLERETTGSGASQAAAGMLAAQVEFGQPGPLLDLGLTSRAMYGDWIAELEELSGVTTGYIVQGVVQLAWDERERQELLRQCSWQQLLGLRVEWWEPGDFPNENPGMTRNGAGALYLPDEGQVDAPRLVEALRTASARLNIEIHEGERVIGLWREGGHVTGVRTPNGTWSASEIVLATGAWTGMLATRFGLEIPVYPVKGQIMTLLPELALGLCPHVTEHVYLVPKADGRVLAGATVEDAGFDRKVTLEGVQEVSLRTLQWWPDLRTVEMIEMRVGLRPATEDGLPVLGRVKGIEGLSVASGHYRNGMLLAPVTGNLMAQVLEGESPKQLQPFSPERVTLRGARARDCEE